MNDTIARFTPNDLDLFFQGKKYETLTSWKQWELVQICEMTFSIGVLATFWFSKVEMIIKLFVQICLHLYDTRCPVRADLPPLVRHPLSSSCRFASTCTTAAVQLLLLLLLFISNLIMFVIIRNCKLMLQEVNLDANRHGSYKMFSKSDYLHSVSKQLLHSKHGNHRVAQITIVPWLEDFNIRDEWLNVEEHLVLLKWSPPPPVVQ